MAEYTVDELADQAGARDLDRECTNVDFLDLHKFLDPWELIGQHLKLTRSQINAINEDYKTTDQKCLGHLQKWKETFAHKATYRVLITALLACGKAEQALKVCKILAQKQGHPDKSIKKPGNRPRRNIEDEADCKQWKRIQPYLTLIVSAVIVLLLAYFVYPFTGMYARETSFNSTATVTVTGPSPMETPVTQIKFTYQPYVILIAFAVIVLLIAYFVGMCTRETSFNSTTTVTATGPFPTEISVTQIKSTPFIDETTPTEADIFSPDKIGQRIVELCIEKLKSPKFNIPDDNHFLNRVAYVMSEFGKNMKNNGGIWQVTPTAFEDTMDTRAHKRLPGKYQQIWEAYDIDWKNVRYKDLDKPFYSALAARLYLSNYPEYIPPAHQIQYQARYWKFKYMAGNGDLQFFIDKVYELEHSV